MPPLRDVLRSPGAFDRRHALYADRASLDPRSECLVLDPDDAADTDDDPEPAKAAGYRYLLMMDDVGGIVANLAAQSPEPSDELRCRALRFYLDRDAFIVL